MSKANEGIEVGYVAKLACIDLTDEERVLFQGQLDQVLHEGLDPRSAVAVLMRRPISPETD